MVGRTVRVAVVGDEGVGKSSLVLAAVHNTFNENPVPTLPPTRLPPDTVESYISPAPATLIVDTCSRPEDKQAWELNVREANAIVLTFAANDFETLRRVAMHWIPELERVGVRNTPIILTACKCDIGDVRAASFHDLIQAILHEYKHIETFLESSAKKQQSVPDIFYYAIKSVVHPTQPLVVFSSAVLQPLCIKALQRIFLLCDENQDGALDDDELNKFQVKCFNAPLQPIELEGVKEVVGDRLPGGLNQKGLTLKGFLFLHALFIEKARTETVWTVLRAFGYGDDLLIEDHFLDAVTVRHQRDQVVELTESSRSFLRDQFRRYDANQDLHLSKTEQDEMFSASPSCAFDEPALEGITVQESGSMGLTEQGFLSLWAYLTAANPRAALSHLLYIGKPLDQADALIKISRPRSLERKKAREHSSRVTFQCFVFGAAGKGKPALLQGLVRQAGQAAEEPTQEQDIPQLRVAVNEVTADWNSKGRQQQVSATLVLRDMPQQYMIESIDLQPCDMAAFVFDASNPESFHAAQDLLYRVTDSSNDTLPCILVAANNESGTLPKPDNMQEELAQFVQELEMQAPCQVSGQTNENSHVYATLVQAALSPGRYTPQTPSRKARQQQGLLSNRATLVLAASAVAILGLYGIWSLNSQEGKSVELQKGGRKEGAGFKEHVNDVKAYLKGLKSCWLHSN